MGFDQTDTRVTEALKAEGFGVAVLQMTSNPEVAVVAREVRALLERVKSELGRATASHG